MGKRVLTGFFAGLMALACVNSGTAQEAPEPANQPEKQAFKPGKFLTEGDYEHIRDALAYLNLTPEDLNYEKKHRDDRLRLKVCDRALDEPLAVPRIAEEAASSFGLSAGVDKRCKHASEFLDSPADRWSEAEDKLDRESRGQLQKKAEGIDESGKPEEARATLDHAFEQAFFGGTAKQIQEFPDWLPEGYDKAWQAEMYAIGQEMFVPLAALARSESGDVSDTQWRKFAGRAAPEAVAESDLAVPGCLDIDKLQDWYGYVDLSVVYGTIRAAALLLASIHAKWAPGYSGVIVREGDESPFRGPPSTVKGVSGGVIAAWEGPFGKFVIGGEGPNTYEGDDFIGIIDLGGDDTYRGRVACGVGLEGRAPISFVLDLSGDDRYLGEDFTQGFGFLGVGILHDLGGGNDVYKSRFCSQGCGLCGYGELYDDGGDDTYTSDSGAQGAGVFGYGHLIDRSGNDVYRGCRFVQGFAQVMGVGVLTDGDGNDLYYAGGKYLHEPLFNDRYQSLSQGFAIGNRYGETGGGVGMLLDEGDGNDVYQADIYGQGSSYWYSLGMLVDEGGNDSYTLGQYGQGGGIHLSAGILVDLKGNDSYTNPYGVGLGGAHDWAVGWLIDRAGNDLYQGNGQGQGLNYSVGILLDCAGDDSRASRDDGNIGKGVNNDISLLLDLAGTDTYTSDEVRDGAFTRRGRHAMVYDVPKGWFPGIDVSTLPTRQNPPPTKVVVQHILIGWKAKNDEVPLKDPERTAAEAESLRDKVLKKARTKGADWADLVKTYSEDSVPESEFTVEPDSPFVKPFREMALSLGKGQIDWCESQFGYHIIKRIE